MIRRAKSDDLDKILSIVRSAQLSLRELGIDQWQDGYPSREVICSDIDAGIGWVLVDTDEVVGYAAIVLTGEEAYKQLSDNSWHTSNDYVVVHRLCVDANMASATVVLLDTRVVSAWHSTINYKPIWQVFSK